MRENLFNDVFEQGTLSGTGELQAITTRLRTVNYNKMIPNTEYRINATGINTVRVYEFDSNYNVLTMSAWISVPYTFTTSSTTVFYKLLFKVDDATVVTPAMISNVTLYNNSKQVVGQGKNLIPSQSEYWELGSHNIDGSKFISQNRIRLPFLIKIDYTKPLYFNTFYNNYKFILRSFEENGTFNRSIGVMENNTTYSSFTSNDVYLGISIYHPSNTTSDLLALIDNGTIKPFICLDSETDKTFEAFIPYSDTHEKVFAVCEDMCLEETMTKSAIEELVATTSEIKTLIGDIEPSIGSNYVSVAVGANPADGSSNCKILGVEILIGGIFANWCTNFFEINNADNTTTLCGVKGMVNNRYIYVDLFTLDNSNFTLNLSTKVRVHYIVTS